MSDSDQEWTCGMGLAAGSEIPARMADLLSIMARNLELHQRSLDTSDAAASEELIANERLAGRMRDVSGYLEALAGEMVGYRDLPAVPHDEAALNTPDVLETFHALIASERSLANLLNESADAFDSDEE
ncbi:MAG: hypothetical protein KC438_04140 [Thermomicrobiales bacterium]|nr:hypothetical protein [Thermomicrobiales bacterium]MCO5222820.1 hypothetical protein [Thermomicrobiales bacterium]